MLFLVDLAIRNGEGAKPHDVVFGGHGQQLVIKRQVWARFTGTIQRNSKRKSLPRRLTVCGPFPPILFLCNAISRRARRARYSDRCSRLSKRGMMPRLERIVIAPGVCATLTISAYSFTRSLFKSPYLNRHQRYVISVPPIDQPPSSIFPACSARQSMEASLRSLLSWVFRCRFNILLRLKKPYFRKDHFSVGADQFRGRLVHRRSEGFVCWPRLAAGSCCPNENAGGHRVAAAR